ncbi:MAG TPA: Yip1 family protein, partial [Holophagaceae bacterium]|nr:Yip1 family protein [Holophagaceae bacterium]
PHPEPEPPVFNPYQPPMAGRLEPAPQAWSQDEPALVPWEDEAAIPGAIDRWWATVRLGFTDPMGLSGRVPSTTPMLPAWLFCLTTGVPSLTLNLALSEMMRQAMSSLFGISSHQNPMVQVLGAVFSLFIGPFVGGAFLHLFLWMWGGTKEGGDMALTIRFSCYAQGVYYMVGWIPILNILLGIGFWIAFSMGLAKAHRTDTWRGFAATLTPVLVCCCIGIGAAIMIPAMLGLRH